MWLMNKSRVSRPWHIASLCVWRVCLFAEFSQGSRMRSVFVKTFSAGGYIITPAILE